MNQPRPFSFDTHFDDGGAVIAVAPSAPRVKRAFTVEEVEAIRADAYREGEAAALASAQAMQARALAELAEAARGGLGALAQVAHNHRVHAAGLAMACGKAIADSALEAFPHAALQAALESLAREFDEAPRLVLRVGAAGEGVAEAAEQVARDIGFPGQIVVRADGGLPRAAFVIEWADGTAVFNPEATAARIADVVASALASDRLHADPIDLSPDGEP